jgi:hypothetical protein
MTWKTEEDIDEFDLDVRLTSASQAANPQGSVTCAGPASCAEGTCATGQCGTCLTACDGTCAGYPDSCGTCNNTHYPCCF